MNFTSSVNFFLNKILKSGLTSNYALEDYKTASIINAVGIITGVIVLAVDLFYLYFGCPIDYFALQLSIDLVIVFTFFISNIFGLNIAKTVLVIFLNVTITMDSSFSGNHNLAPGLDLLIFSTLSICLVTHDFKSWVLFLLSISSVFVSHFLIHSNLLPVIPLNLPLGNTNFLHVSFSLAAVSLVAVSLTSRYGELNTYKELVSHLDSYNQLLRTQEEELKQNYEELSMQRENLEQTVIYLNEKNSHLSVAMKIAKMGSHQFYFGTNLSNWSEELLDLLEVKDKYTFEPKTFITEFVHPDDLTFVQQEIGAAIVNLSNYECSFRIFTAEKNIKYVRAAGEVFYDEDNNMMVLRGLVQDVSDYILTQKQLVEANDEMEHFVYRANHDIKGPLATIKGLIYIETIKGNTNDPVLNKISSLVDSLASKINKLLLVNEILNYKYNESEVKLGEVFKEALAVISKIKGYEAVSIHLKVDDTFTIQSDKILLKHILVNVLDNAIIFRSKAEAYIHININLQDNFYLIEVEDNGEGIPEMQIPQVFERNYRGSIKSEGAGMGLFIVKKCMEILNGEVEIRSFPDKGTTVYLKLPHHWE